MIMHPPFTRLPGRLAAAGEPGCEEEFPVARRQLRRLGQQDDISGRISAGLGALFIPLADRMVRPGGRLGKRNAQDHAYRSSSVDQTRHLLAAHYHIECVICSHETAHCELLGLDRPRRVAAGSKQVASRGPAGAYRSIRRGFS